MRQLPLLVCLINLFLIEGLYAQGLPVVKVDFNMNGRPAQEVRFEYPNPTHFHWVVGHPLSDTVEYEGVTFILKKGARGEQLAPTYYKASVQTGNDDAKFTNDGVYIKDGDFAEGSSMDLIIKGLPAGSHKLRTFHNMTDNLTPEAVCPMDIYVNDVLVVDDLIPTVRLERITEIASAELELEAVDGKDIVISFRAETSGSQAVKNVMINGFYLNAVDVANQARVVDPIAGNEYLEVPIGGDYTLKWSRAAIANSHDIYFGTDSLGVSSADRDSPYYMGNQAQMDTTYTVHNLNTLDRYYWRVDEVVSDTEVYKGNVWKFGLAQLAFPGAEGFGRFARGGRGGKVVYVTNLNDSGPGSLREAVTNDIGPRTIMFNVGGVIQLESRLVLSDRYVTIAGQTAPGQGIEIRSSPFGIGADDAIVRFVRLRLGAGPTADGMGMNGDHSIMDHCSIAWTIDEAFSSRGAKNITLQRTLISEALNAAGHQNYPEGTEHGYAATIGGAKGSFHHNLLAHNNGRNWSMGGQLDANNNLSGWLDIRNNVVYNWGSRATDGGAHEVNFVGNYYKPGEGTTRLPEVLTMEHENIGHGTQRAYFAGNVVEGYVDETNQEMGRRASYRNGAEKTYETFVDEPFFEAPVTTQSAYHAYKMVLSDIGANQPFFDAHDARMVEETLTGTFSVRGSVTDKPGFPDSHEDSGGFLDFPSVERPEDWDTDRDGLPDWWEDIHGLNPNSSPGDFSDANGDPDNDGFTNLEDYLNWMAQPNYSTENGDALLIDVRELSRGFTEGVSYTVSSTTNGSATVEDGIVEFTPTEEGLCAFDFTVTDSDGHSMTRTVNVVNGVKIDKQLREDQEIEFGELEAATYDQGEVTPEATATSGLPVAFATDNADIAQVENGVIKFVGVGTVNITATQEGNDKWNAAEPVTRELTIEKGIQTIDFSELPTMTLGDVPYLPRVTSSAGLPITLRSDNAGIASIVNGRIVARQEGSVTIVAEQPGDELWLAAEPVVHEMEVLPKPSMDVVKVLTPNGDGDNDALIIKEIERYPENKVEIFDRNGRRLRVIENYNNTSRRFDGWTDSGSLLEDGTYFYRLEWSDAGKKEQQGGWFYLAK